MRSLFRSANDPRTYFACPEVKKKKGSKDKNGHAAANGTEAAAADVSGRRRVQELKS